MSTPRIGPIAPALPARSLDRARSFEVADALSPPEVSRAVLERLHDRSGIETRGVSVIEPDGSIPLYGMGLPGTPASPRIPGTAERMEAYTRAAIPLGVEAAGTALRLAELDPGRITHLVTASCTGFSAPGVDLAILRRLGLQPSVRRTHVGFMGCHAAVNALATAAAYARESSDHRVLVVCVEVSTVHFHHDTRLDRLISNILFADGAAATVVGLETDDRSTPEILATASRLIDDSSDAMAWEIGDRGFDMTLAAEVPDLIGGVLAEWVDEVLAEHGMRRTDVGGWAIHPGGPRVIDAVSEALELPATAATTSLEVLRTCGNMSSATLLHILGRFQSEDVPRPWAGLAFGPGLAGEMILIR